MNGKRKIAAMILLAVQLSMAAGVGLAVEAGGKTYLVVNNPNAEDRLNLRETEDAQAQSLGKYYNGTYVKALTDIDREWVMVQVGMETGCLTGWMQRKYLNDAPEHISVVYGMPVLTVKDMRYGDIYPDRGGESESMGCLNPGTPVTVMGMTETWYHVQAGGITGFMRAKAFNNELQWKK